MGKLLTVKQARAFDKFAQEKLGIPALILMENAGRGVAEESARMVGGSKGYAGGLVVSIVCGTGNNGGDGFVAARHLINAGAKVKVYVVGLKAKLKNDPKLNLNILLKMKQKVKWVKSGKDLIGLNRATLLIDALFGIGLNSPVTGLYRQVIAALNNARVPIVSVDVPSGLDAETGKILGLAVRAKKTVTFVAPKKGCFLADGPRQCGRIIVKDIGVR
ncbi:MAG: NAD(P)H-hydrate epimerase [Candidatus Margulisbacteria bacterium]|jgi:NAD(P)H-hydrate epimerase|nr:NAD(P)H-hydrate epimerase [Candidatus Margulisiibacteriota bacterium]